MKTRQNPQTIYSQIKERERRKLENQGSSFSNRLTHLQIQQNTMNNTGGSKSNQVKNKTGEYSLQSKFDRLRRLGKFFVKNPFMLWAGLNAYVLRKQDEKRFNEILHQTKNAYGKSFFDTLEKDVAFVFGDRADKTKNPRGLLGNAFTLEDDSDIALRMKEMAEELRDGRPHSNTLWLNSAFKNGASLHGHDASWVSS